MGIVKKQQSKPVRETKKEVQYSATLRIPTASKYAYIEVALTGTKQEIVGAYYQISETYWKESRARAKAAGKKIIEETI